MNRPLLQYGSKGKHVEELQELLNKWMTKTDGVDAILLNPDGDFRGLTKEAVKYFQFKSYLLEDGKVGNLTWSALLGIEMYNCFDIPSTYVNAPDMYRCWAAASAMLLNRNAPLGRTPGVDFETQPNGTVGGIDNSHENMQKFADKHGMQMFKAQSLSCLQLVNLLDQHGRLMLNIKGINSNLIASSGNDSHLVLLTGARGNGQPKGTTITIRNPSNGGENISDTYQYIKNRFPNLTYQVFYTFSNRSTPV